MLVSWIHPDDEPDFGSCMWRLRERWKSSKRKGRLVPWEYVHG